MSQGIAAVECGNLVHRFYLNIDHRRHDEVADLVCEDLIYVTPRNDLSSARAVIEAGRARPQDETARHVITNFAVDEVVDGSATGRGYLLMFRSAGKAPSGVEPVPPIESLVDINATFRREPAGWRISRMVLQTIFVD